MNLKTSVKSKERSLIGFITRELDGISKHNVSTLYTFWLMVHAILS